MTKIESRPSKGWLGDYVFLIDFEGHRQDERVARVLDRIRDRCSILKIFGSYPRFHWSRCATRSTRATG